MPGVQEYPRALKRAVRDVQVRLSDEGGHRPYALATADFEPLPVADGGPLVFTGDVPDGALPPAFAAAYGDGVLGQLRAWSFNGRPPFALRVRLREAAWREGSSSADGFAWAGRRAAHEFSRRFHRRAPARPLLTGTPPPPAARAVRGVHVRLVTTSACGVFAVATADFEPLPEGSGLAYDFVCEVPEGESGELLERELADAYEQGVLDALCGDDATPLPRTGFRIRLTAARTHLIDSNPATFARAGRMAAAEALRCLREDGTPPPVLPVPTRTRPGTTPPQSRTPSGGPRGRGGRRRRS
ncbi:hypothetical protein [Streptomyces sp. NPDC048172]|uniref:hypothetical protein n=1 Tax=Streptomyces sp. NPDC048172 TaxID=3365505 RepID=UPI003710034B